MSDNPRPAPGQDPSTSFALPGHRVVTLEGIDAVRFAQAQFMGDVLALAPGQWQWNGWLTPKGRVVALFALLRVDDAQLLLLLPDADADSFVAALRRFVFRSKVTLRVHDALHATGRFTAAAEARGDLISGDLAQGLEFDFGGEGGARTLHVATSRAADDDQARGRWEAFDLAHGLPRLGPEQVEQWTPQQLSLERLRAFSVRKGCYPGQEIVARTHFLGQAKRGLVLLHTGAPVSPGTQVHAGEQALGTVVSSAGTVALAVLPLDHDATALTVDGQPVREQRLLDGLAR